MTDIKILGAGISGLTAAINLAKDGHRVQVFDSAQTSGKRFSGDLQGLENWTRAQNVIEEIKKMNIETDFYYKAFDKVFLTNCVDEVEVKFKIPLFYLVKRGAIKGSLDQSLKNQAKAAGVKLNFDAKAKENLMNIVATGPKPKVHIAIDRGIVFNTHLEDIAALIINNEAAYRGYSYLLVAGGYGCMCTVVFHDLTKVSRCWSRTKQIFEKLFDLNIKNAHPCGGIGDFQLPMKLKTDNRLYVGEAAGIQDVLFGFGIRSSMVSGYLASQSIVHDSNYVKLINRRLTNHSKATVVDRFLWEKMGKDNYEFLFRKIKETKDPWLLFNQLYSFSFKHRLLYPLAARYLRKTYKLP